MVRVLVIERDPLFRDMIQAMLERTGHSTQTAVNVSEGLALMLYGRFDAIIADLSMRDMLGRAALTAIAQARAAVPVIGMTDGTPRNPHGGGFGSAAAVIAKPIIERELLKVLDQVLKRHAP